MIKAGSEQINLLVPSVASLVHDPSGHCNITFSGEAWCEQACLSWSLLFLLWCRRFLWEDRSFICPTAVRPFIFLLLLISSGVSCTSLLWWSFDGGLLCIPRWLSRWYSWDVVANVMSITDDLPYQQIVDVDPMLANPTLNAAKASITLSPRWFVLSFVLCVFCPVTSGTRLW